VDKRETTNLGSFFAMIAAVVSIACPPSKGHVGPPFPILIDVPAGDLLVSVWADPDIGEATFFAVLESADGSEPDGPMDMSLWVQPVSGRLARSTVPAERQRLRNRVQFVARPDFDKADRWSVGVRMVRPGAEPLEVTAEVESTPPGTGPWDLLIYLFPFAFLGGLWIAAMSRMRRRRNEVLAHAQGTRHQARASEATAAFGGSPVAREDEAAPGGSAHTRARAGRPAPP